MPRQQQETEGKDERHKEQYTDQDLLDQCSRNSQHSDLITPTGSLLVRTEQRVLTILSRRIWSL